LSSYFVYRVFLCIFTLDIWARIWRFSSTLIVWLWLVFCCWKRYYG